MSDDLRKPFTPEALDPVLDLLLDYRLATSVRVYPTLWRLRLLLSSRVWDPDHDTAVWVKSSDQIAAFGMLWRRRLIDPSIILEYFFDPGLTDCDLLTQIVNWGRRRTQQIAMELQQPVKLFAGEHGLESCDQVDFPSLGFVQSVREGEPHTVMLLRSLKESIREVPPPGGYSLISLDTSSDLTAYENLYSFTNVNPDFRQELLQSDEYGHLVLSDTAGEWVAFCEYSISRAEWKRGAERLGWIDYVGTREDHQGQGLGVFIMTAALSDLKEMGSEAAMLVTISDNFPAIGLYEKLGFTRVGNDIQRRYRYELAV